MDDKYIYNDRLGVPDLETFLAVRNEAHQYDFFNFLQKDKISIKRMKKTTCLNLTWKKHQILNLDFLKFFPNADYITIESKRLRDLSGLKYAPKLVELFLIDMHVNSIAPIGECTALYHIAMYNVKVMNVDFFELKKLVRLSDLTLENCGVTDISWASGLNALKSVDLEGNSIMHFAPLKNLPQLEYIGYNSELFEPPFDELPD